MKFAIFYCFSFLALLASSLFNLEIFKSFLWALIFSTLIVLVLKIVKSNLVSYLLFFSISVTSALGLTKVLTGTHAGGTSPMLYGLSFYTASLAYLHAIDKVKLSSVWKVANPLLVFTGPIALFVKDITKSNTRRRISYFLPFILVGIFYFQIVGAPLFAYMFMINITDVVSAFVFATIFEIFVYANFCGLSLMVYGLTGVFGYKIPLNFKQPFTSSNLINFWKGWHTSLSAVLKTLFYKQFRSRFGLIGALLAVYISSAVWHGVSINFLLWGLFHAAAFYATVVISRSNIPFKSWLNIFLMIFAIIFGRLLFADSNTSRLFEKLSFNYIDFDIFNLLLDSSLSSQIALLLGLFLIGIEFIFQKNKLVSKRTYKHLRLPLSQLFIAILFILLVMDVGGDFAIYGQR